MMIRDYKPKRFLTNLDENHYAAVSWIVQEYDVLVQTQATTLGMFHNIYGNEGEDYTEMFDRIDKVLKRGKYADGEADIFATPSKEEQPEAIDE